MARKWIICMHCRYISECQIGQVRTHNTEADALISSDTGCYDYEHYFTLYNNKQLKLFKPERKLLQA